MTSAEYAEWRAVERIEPFLAERIDFNAAAIRHTVACTVSKQPGKLGDYLLRFKPQPEQTMKQQQRILKAYATVWEKANGNNRQPAR